MLQNGSTRPIRKLGTKRMFQVVNWIQANREYTENKLSRRQIAAECAKAIDFPTLTWESIRKCLLAANVNFTPGRDPRQGVGGGVVKGTNTAAIQKLKVLVKHLYDKLGEPLPIELDF